MLSLVCGDPDRQTSNLRSSAAKDRCAKSYSYLFLLTRDLNEDAVAEGGGAGCRTGMSVATALGIAVWFGSAQRQLDYVLMLPILHASWGPGLRCFYFIGLIRHLRHVLAP